ncbi:Uncharacterized protein LOCC1_G008017, partial [Lachnellula occidentalis]
MFNPFASSSPSPKTITEITQLFIYPIKSCRGIQVTEAFLSKRGLDLDRRWMFVDGSSGKFITIRDISELTLIDTALASTSTSTSATPDNKNDNNITGEQKQSQIQDDDPQEQLLKISIRNTNLSVTIPARPSAQWLTANTTLTRVSIWGHDTDGYAYPDSVNDIFSSFLGKQVKLVYKGPTPRVLRGNGAPEILGRVQDTGFPDVLPVLLASEASLGELNGRLRGKGGSEVGVERFRANVVVRGGEGGMGAWSEDCWKRVRVVDGDGDEEV